MRLSLLALLFLSFSGFAQINERDFHCIDSLFDLGNVQIYGNLQTDEECEFTHLKIDGKWIDWEEGTNKLIKKLVKKKKVHELLFAVSELHLNKETVLLEESNVFKKSDNQYVDPIIEEIGGAFRIKAWFKEQTSMPEKSTYRLAVVTVDGKGKVSRSNLGEFTWNSDTKTVE